MQRKVKTRILSAVTAATLCVSVVSVAVPAALAYSDVSGSTLSEAVSVLSDMGIISGYQDGTFQPDKTLTRAEFAKLAIYAEGKDDQISANAYRSLFNDIATSHWALGCVNLAYSEGLVSGYGNGTFGPDDTVTCGQAATILLHLLGYTDSQIGPFWPQDDMVKAKDLGLLDGVSAGAYDALTRGQAALMLYAMIQQTNASGTDYIKTLAASTMTSAVVLDNNAEADDGTTGNLKVYANGSISYYEQAKQVDSSLVGLRGTILLNKSGEVKGFLPDDTNAKTVTVSSTTAAKIKAQSGSEYAVSGSTPVIFQGSVTTYANCYYDLANAGSVKLYYNTSGSSVNLIVASDSSEETVVVANCESKVANYFATQFGISGSYTIYKNGKTATADDLEQYDVATYNKTTASLLVSSTKVTGYIEAASPSMAAATSVTVLGKSFSVLDEAQSSLAAFDVGKQVTLLLTADGQVAAVYSPSTVSATMVGVLNSTGTNSDGDTTAAITLTNGIKISAELYSSSEADGLTGCLVKVSPASEGVIYLSAFSNQATSSNLNVVAKTLGSAKLSPDVKIYDQVSGGAVAAVDLDDIKLDTVAAASINSYSTNSAGEVNLLVLNDVTGNCYTYGILRTGTTTSGSGTLQVSNKTVKVEYGSGLTTSTYITGYSLTDGDFGGVFGSSSTGKALAMATLTSATVTRSAINTSDSDNQTVTVNGVQIPISDNVVVYNAKSSAWTTLTAAKSFTGSFTVYYDKTASTGGQVRVIVAN
jgi:hypothetical protein